jgi:serine/threonine protein kinase
VGFFAKLFGGGGKGKRKGPPVNIGKRFDLLGRTGQGSMSKVWRARDRSLGRMVCLKMLDKEKTRKFEERFKGLQRPSEGEICVALRHKNIVQTFEYGWATTGEPFLVMELIDGMGLNFLVETNSPQLQGHRIDYLTQIADGLEYLHDAGYMHRDVCPRNTMVTKDHVVKLIDFGLTIPLRPEFCRPGNRTGTPNYLAPEVIKRTTTDHRVDLFALGVTAYEVFTGQLPWEKKPSSDEMLRSHLNSAGKDPAEARPDLDAAAVKLLKKAIERDPRERFQTAAQFREALKALPKQDY